MTSQTRTVLLVVAGLVVLAAVATWLSLRGHQGNAWPAEAKAAFVKNCVEKCRAAPGMTEDKYAYCDSACTCSADESEKVVSIAELEEIGLAMKTGKTAPSQTETLNRVKGAAAVCTARAAKEQK